MDGSEPTTAVSARRRDFRVHAVEASLPAAQPVQSARASTPTPGGGRRIAPWLLVSIGALVIVGVITAGALSLSMRDEPTASGVGAVSGRDALSAQCVPRALDENGERSDRCTATADRDDVHQQAPDAPAVETVHDRDSESPEELRERPQAPDAAAPAAPGPSDPPLGTPDADSPGTPAAPAPAPAPAPVAPAPPAPAPPAPAPPAPAPAIRPLAFTGISENHAIGLLGIRILSSYTLSLSGQPGATASVTYGGWNAGSVTFDSGGRASITLGGTLLSAGLGNPTIRAAYTDGTAGSAIQSPRDSI